MNNQFKLFQTNLPTCRFPQRSTYSIYRGQIKPGRYYLGLCLCLLLLGLAGSASSRPLNIGVMEATPWAYFDDVTFQPKGTLVDYTRRLLSLTSLDYQLIVVPTKRLSYMAAKGQIDIAITLDDGRIHQFMNPIKLLESVEVIAFSLQINPQTELTLPLQPLEVMHGYKASQHPGQSLEVAINNAEQLFALLDAKRIDSGFGLKPLLMFGANTRRHTEQLHRAHSLGYADIVIWSNPKIAPDIPRQLTHHFVALNI